MPIKVIGAGLGRTGTLSLKMALEELGFVKCYHMVEVFANGQHVRAWDRRSRGEPIDWDTLFEGYQATVDWPACTFYRELMRHYPEAKVVLSVRDPERWYESSRQTIYYVRDVPVPDGKPFPHVNDTAEFRARVQRAARIVRTGGYTIIVIMALILAWLASRILS